MDSDPDPGGAKTYGSGSATRVCDSGDGAAMPCFPAVFYVKGCWFFKFQIGRNRYDIKEQAKIGNSMFKSTSPTLPYVLIILLSLHGTSQVGPGTFLKKNLYFIRLANLVVD
jgi:hypothetical protein